VASSRHIVAIDFGSYLITDTAGDLFSFAESGSPSTLPTGTQSFKGILETAAVRIRIDGTAPTATEGELIASTSEVILDESVIAAAQFIRDTATDGVLKGHFYNVEASVLLGGG
jgi:hypothetical protein